MNHDVHMVESMVARYTKALAMLEASTSHLTILDARLTLGHIKEQAQALWVAIVEGGLTHESAARMEDAIESGILDPLSELRELDLDSLILNPPNTETLEQRGVHT